MEKRDELIKTKFKMALHDLVCEESMSRITVKDVVEKAGLSRSAFNRYYKNTDELLQELQKEASEKLVHAIEEGGRGNIEYYLRYIKTNFDYYEPFFYSEFSEDFRRIFVDNTAEQMREIGIWNDEKKTEIASEFLGPASFSLIKYWIDSGFEMPIEALAKRLYDFNKAIIAVEIENK